MRDRVLAAVDELGYEPDILAQSLRRKETRTIGFVVGDISNPLFAQIALGAEGTLRENGYSMLLTNSENDPRRDAGHVSLLRQRRVDGLLLSTASEDSPELFAALEGFEGPVVLIDRELPKGSEPAPSSPTTAAACATRSATSSTSATGGSA